MKEDYPNGITLNGKDNLLKLSPIYKLMVANRGEIALRILRAAQSLQIQAVAVYSMQESGSEWLKHFNESFCLGMAIFPKPISILMQ